MQLYDLALFIHMLGLIALFGGFVLFHRAGARLRASATAEEVSTWLGLLDATGPMFPSGLLMLLASGLYMTFTRWQPELPWITMSIVGLLVIMILGAAVVDRHRKAIRKQLAGTTGPLTAGLTRLIRNPVPWMMAGMLNGIALDVVFLMTTKLQWLLSVTVISVSIVLGIVFGFMAARK
jgi:hypothetical protein